MGSKKWGFLSGFGQMCTNLEMGGWELCRWRNGVRRNLELGLGEDRVRRRCEIRGKASIDGVFLVMADLLRIGKKHCRSLEDDDEC